MTEIEAVVLAARPNDGRLAGESQEPYEANIDIAGQPMVKYVLDALNDIPSVVKIHLIGPAEGIARYKGGKVETLEPGKDLFDNVRLGISAAQTECVLICASDVPLVTKPIVEAFIQRCLESEADFCYPVLEKGDCDKAFPGTERTYVTTKEGSFTGGNLLMVRKSALTRAWPMVERMITYRKSPFKMAMALGPVLLIKFLLKTVSIAELEQKVGRLLEMKPKAILNVAPEIGIDVDKPSDLELCRRILGK
ncbi:MAG: nucleotidyltransferase family protein [Bacillota bacterium]